MEWGQKGQESKKMEQMSFQLLPDEKDTSSLPQIGNGDYRLFDGDPLPFRLTFSKHKDGAVEDIGVLFEADGELKFRGGTDACARMFFDNVIKKYKDTYG